MFKHPKAVGAALFVFALAGAAPASAETLSAGAIKKLFPGTYQARVDGHTVTIRARANGTMTGSVMIASDKGRWWVKGNALCVKFSSWGDGKTRCGAIKRAGSWYQAIKGGKVALKFRPYAQKVAAHTPGG